MHAQKTLSLLALFFSATPFAAATEFTLFAAGVDPANPNSYYNINQGSNPTCWAAVGSNVVAHWQDHHVENLPAGTPTGTSVYDTFIGMYSTHAGGFSYEFYRWWLGHTSGYELPGYGIADNWESLGGYYDEIYTESEVYQIAWYKNFRYESKDASRAIYYALNQGLAFGIGIPNSRHALTVYGAAFDPETELVTELYVCDSSGALFDTKDISRIRVGERGSDLCLVAYYQEGFEYADLDRPSHYLGNIYFLGNDQAETLAFISSGIPIPEPSAFGLLAGLGALAFTASRRRRKH